MPSGAGSSAVVFSGGVDGVLACGVVLVHVGFAVSENNMWKIGDQCFVYDFRNGEGERGKWFFIHQVGLFTNAQN